MNHFGLPVTQFNSSSKQQIDDHIMRTQLELDQVMRIMRSNIEKLAQRGDKLDELTLRADALHESTNQFGTTSHTIVRHYRRPPYLFYASIILSVFTLLVSAYYLYLCLTAKQGME
ncbi:hypothetical protein PFISCL1PPCAC_10323 [Pristionchus fissidentatus]|uniref:V-SNARE coiled-coil homology domain-containing protein n=1 Tax=Pristionchus fissidentatus TaxID=1538716 RepID=A0AAV5VK92_9BILA|nr:hypothetical protein PFISCL1PPCAC_10323 [Pristionchus fissidentatus]